jgi:hypothetical protein
LLALLYGFSFCLAAFQFGKARGKLATLPFIFMAGVLISFSRENLNTGDLPVYAFGFADSDWDIYYLRDLSFWYLGKTLSAMVGGVHITFFVIDMLIIFLLSHAFSGRINAQFLVMLYAFPTILGFTNIYRQELACVLFMIAINRMQRRAASGAFLGVAITTVHAAMAAVNLSLLAASLLAWKKWLGLIVILSAAFILLNSDLTSALLEAAGGTDSRGGTAIPYIALGILMHLGCFRILRSSARMQVIYSGLIFNFLLGAMLLMVAPASTGSRIMMISIYLAGFATLNALSEDAHPHRARKKAWLTAYIGALLVTPWLVSDSAWHLLFGYQLD